MKRFLSGLALLGVLTACTPRPLQAQPNALVQVESQVDASVVQTPTGENNLYRFPGPQNLLVRTDKPAFITSIFLPSSGPTEVVDLGQVPAYATTNIKLTSSRSTVDVFTIASLQPMDLTTVSTARSWNDIANIVKTSAAALPKGAYNVSQLHYRITDFGTLSIDANQDGAEVQLDNKYVGRTPLALQNVPVGNYTLKLRKTVNERGGRLVFTGDQMVSVYANRTTFTKLRLRAEAGRLNVTSSIPALVRVEGQGTDSTPFSAELAPDTVSITITPNNKQFAAQNILVRVTSNTTSTVSCSVSNQVFKCDTP